MREVGELVLAFVREIDQAWSCRVLAGREGTFMERRGRNP